MENTTITEFEIKGLTGLYNEYNFQVPKENIRGEIPKELYGVLYKNGPGKNEVSGKKNGHWFDGDGMLSAFYFKDGRVTFKNAYVKTPWYLQEQQAGKRIFQTLGSLIDGGMKKNLMASITKQKNSANTNIIFHAGKLLALYEAGKPFSIDPLTLSTLQEETFNDQLGRYATFCAHPKIHPKTGEMYTLGSKSLMKYLELSIFKIDHEGNLSEVMSLPLDKRRTLVHDFILLENHIILTYLPYYPKSILSMFTGSKPLSENLYFNENDKNTIFLIDLSSKKYKTFDTEAQFIFHYINGHKSGNDFIFHNLPNKKSTIKTLGELIQKKTIKASPPLLQTVTIKNGEKVAMELMEQVPAEMPSINPKYEGIKNKYFYANYYRTADVVLSGIILKSDYNGHHISYDFGVNQYAGEPLFVPKDDGQDEDDGWVMSLVYDENTHKSYLSIIDAKDFRTEVARINLPFHVPLGFHSHFVPGDNIRNFDTFNEK